jgi:hypothetical protein
MDISNTSTTTLNDDFNQVKRLLNQQHETREQQFNKPIKGLRGIENTYDFATHNRTIQKKADDCKLYCPHNKEIEAKPKSANEIKNKILNDLKSGVEILEGNNIECNLSHFHKPVQLLNSKDLDISKLDITNQYDDKQCRYKIGAHQTSYTVVYDKIELFTITNIDSPTRFPDAKQSTSGLNFDLKIHPGLDNICSKIDLTTANSLLSAKERIETDIKSGITTFKDQNKNDISYGRSSTVCLYKKINSLEKTLKLLESDSINSTKLEIKDIFGNDFSDMNGYTVFYDNTKLFTINNIDQGYFGKRGYTRIKHFEVKFDDSYYALYNSSLLVLDDAMNLRNDIQNDLEIGIETIQEHIENNDTDKEYYNEQIENINKMLKLLDSKDIDILKLKQTDFYGLRDINNDIEYDYDDWNIESGYTVLHNDSPLFSIKETTDEKSSNDTFEITLF